MHSVSSRGHVWLWFLCQRRRPEVTVISKGDVPLTYLLQFSFPNDLFSTFSFARFSQSVTVGTIWLCWKGRVTFQLISSSSVYGDGNFLILSRVFSSTHSCHGITGMFLHVRCIPHQNSQWLFWASVWNIWADVKLLPFVLSVRRMGTGADLPIQSNEAMAFRWMSGLISMYLPCFPSLWQGAKPRTPTSFSFLHGCCNLRSPLTSFQTSFICFFLWTWRRAKRRTLSGQLIYLFGGFVVKFRFVDIIYLELCGHKFLFTISIIGTSS